MLFKAKKLDTWKQWGKEEVQNSKSGKRKAKAKRRSIKKRKVC